MKKFQLGIIALLLFGVVAGGALAWGGGHMKARHDGTQMNGTSQKWGAMQKAQQAIQNNDFASWQQAMATVAPNTTVTQDQFNNLVQETQARQKVEQAIASNDFESWKSGMTTLLQLQQSQLTQDRFNQLVKFHQRPHRRGMHVPR